VAKVKQFVAHMKPSLMMKRLLRHQGDVSEGSKANVLATCRILGKKITFYTDGTHVIHGKMDVTEEEMFKSHILRYAHASLLIGEPVGDKRKIYVDATVEPIRVWLYGVTIQTFVKRAKAAIELGKLSPDFVLDQHPENSEKEITNVGNVRLFGRHIDRPSVQDGNIRKAFSSGNSTVHYDTN